MKIAALILALSLTFGSVGVKIDIPSKEAESRILSPAIEVLSEMSPMAASGIRGNELYFSDDLFCRAINLSKIKSVTITEVPPENEGALYVGSNVLAKGTTVYAENLLLMSFGASDEFVGSSHFSFSYDDEPYEIRCDIFMLEKENSAPVINTSAQTGSFMNTYKSVSKVGYLSANDPDGDEIHFEVVSYPVHGSVRFADTDTGEYVYTPFDKYVGNDGFSCVAVDKYGNYSKPFDISVSVKALSEGNDFDDLAGSLFESCAISVSESGIMGGKRMGGKLCFEPDKEISRADFVLMALGAAGINNVPDCSGTVFFDDSKINPGIRDYIAYAYEKGFITGEYDVEGNFIFDPDESIKRAEAAYILYSVLGFEKPMADYGPKDIDSVPIWAEDAVMTLCQMGIFHENDGLFSPDEKLTRIEAAYMFSKVLEIRK